MHLILTHEQADFDGVAAAIAAHLLDPGSDPVLPRRLNRNVRAFLTLYGERLPFVSYEDLSEGPIERITLVDTQSLPSLRGLTEETKVHIVDHHPQDEGLPASWTQHLQQTGAATTILALEMQSRGESPGLVAATLMLLGIYEDTGSLTYAGTTTQDMMACAWLLEQGASLALVADFLNHPLSPEQRDLYEALLESADTTMIQGVSIVIAAAEAGEVVDEISTLAHKLRDVFDPAGLFVLVGMNSNTQLVARSSARAVDVGRVAQSFGGGGHQRAAAALIRGKSVEQVRSELTALLASSIEPPLTVAELMSRGPQVLESSTSILEASQRMKRSGHEGYPVVEDSEIVGLLTRRAVDRAMAHDMGERPVGSIMDAGSLTVHPEDSVEHLQQLMIRHDWGQVPVADAQTGEIVGIVTRTDLLRNLGDGVRRQSPLNLGDRLEAALPASRLALFKVIAATAEVKEIALYVVGGFVRDLLLGEPSVDFDLVTEGNAIPLAQSLASSYGGDVHSHARFGTAKWQLDMGSNALREQTGVSADSGDLPSSIDFVTARSEFYAHPTALPLVQEGSIKLDLHRRDFTINTLAMRLDGAHYGRLLDHWGGRADLQQGLIRVLHSLSFVDDPTRMLRAVRLEQRLGFAIESRTLQLLQDARALLDRVSGDRVRSELEQIFREKAWDLMLARLRDLGLLHAIDPELAWDDWLSDRWKAVESTPFPGQWKLQFAPERDWLRYALWTLRLEPASARRVADRLRLGSAEREGIVQASSLKTDLARLEAEARPSQIARALESARVEALVAVWLASDEGRIRRWIDQFLREWRWVRPQVDGDALRQLGLAPGPQFGAILSQLRDRWLDGDIKSADEERRALEQQIQEARKHG